MRRIIVGTGTVFRTVGVGIIVDTITIAATQMMTGIPILMMTDGVVAAGAVAIIVAITDITATFKK